MGKPNDAISMLLRSADLAEMTKLGSSSSTLCSDPGGIVSQPPEEGQADVLLHPLPILQHAEDVLLRRQGETLCV